ncbi:MAG: hypothetical protein QM820_56945 [Minicystis sp.]
MSNRIFALALGSALALAAGTASAGTESGTGYLRMSESSSNSASKTVSGYEFGIGYSASVLAFATDWDKADDCSVLYGASACASIRSQMANNYPSCGSNSFFRSICVAQMKAIYSLMVADTKTGYEAKASASFEVPATLFNADFDLFGLYAYADAASTGSAAAGYEVDVVGAVVASGSYSIPRIWRIANYCHTLAEASGDYWLGPIPVTASAEAEGCIYVDVNLAYSNNTLSGTLTPGASVDASLSAGIGTSFASGGVYGSLTVIDASVPFTVSGKASSSSVTLSESAKLTMTGMDGEVGLYASLFGERWEEPIFSWDGLTYANTTLFSSPSQTISF